MTIQVTDPGLMHYVERIERNEPFTFVRMGDGEWSAILGDRTRTSSGSQALNIRRLRKMMRQSIIQAHRDVNYVVTMRPGSQRPGIENWLEHNKPAWLKFKDCRVFYKASKQSKLYPFIQALRESKLPIIVVGPERLKKLHGRVFGIVEFIKIPNKDCFVMIDQLMLRVLALQRSAIVLFSAGPAAKIMCWHLHSQIGGQSFLLDLGSLFDPYVGKRTRQYHKRLLREPWRIKANLTGIMP